MTDSMENSRKHSSLIIVKYVKNSRRTLCFTSSSVSIDSKSAKNHTKQVMLAEDVH